MTNSWTNSCLIPQVQILKNSGYFSWHFIPNLHQWNWENSFNLKVFCIHVYLLLWVWRGGGWLFLISLRKWCLWYTPLASGLLLMFWRSQGYRLQKYLVSQWLEEWELNESSLAEGNYDIIAYAFCPVGTASMYWLSSWHMDVFLATCSVRQIKGIWRS